MMKRKINDTQDLMIDENKMVDIISLYLDEQGFDIIGKCNTKQKGTDIEAQKQNIKLLLEVKGETSSMDSSKKGTPFKSSQILTRVGKAVVKVMELRDEYKVNNNTHDTIVGIALPSNKEYNKRISRIKSSLDELKIIVIWYDGEIVEVEGCKELVEKIKLSSVE